MGHHPGPATCVSIKAATAEFHGMPLDQVRKVLRQLNEVPPWGRGTNGKRLLCQVMSGGSIRRDSQVSLDQGEFYGFIGVCSLFVVDVELVGLIYRT